ncbi:protein FANTASTIC FOUR 3-like [Benincasa hispida]|uniref:protein FANTASTIC FOUR 3-like n=1 Tax=Benincasa hispida TaxID=102211 RepID=UPI0019011B17|nr:protein FANTASTIC FOUR 3-like [Benincasa hispida]
MATMVYRSLQSCLDSNLVDQRTFIFPPFDLPLKHPFPDSSKSLIHSDQCQIPNNSSPAGIPNSGAGGWTFLQSLDVGETPVSKPESFYVHPLAKRFNPTGLSEKSLKLCTENLGNETGSDIIENNIFSPETDGEDLQRKWERKSHSYSNSHSHQFPPPLTTIGETESFRVMPHREEGRLIIAAVRAPARLPCFQAERSGGRLKLCFMTTEESEEMDSGDEEVGAETETATMMKNEENGENNGRVNLEQFSIATF